MIGRVLTEGSALVSERGRFKTAMETGECFRNYREVEETVGLGDMLL